MLKSVTEILRQFMLFFRNLGLIVANKAKLKPEISRSLLWDYLNLKLLLLINPSKNTKISFLGHNLYIFDLRTALSLIESIFIENEYYFSTGNLKPNIIDYGSNIGLSVIYFKTLYPKCRISAYEADPDTFAVLNKNVKSFRYKNVKLVNAAVWNKNGQINFYVDRQGPGSPLMSTSQARMPKDKITVKSLKASETIADSTDMLKIDIEGAEKTVMDDLALTGKIDSINQISLEYHHHIDIDTDDFSKILQLLEKHHFGYQIHASQNTPFILRTFEDIQVHAYKKLS